MDKALRLLQHRRAAANDARRQRAKRIAQQHKSQPDDDGDQQGLNQRARQSRFIASAERLGRQPGGAHA